MTALRGAVFDLDGTLFDSMGLWAKIDVDFLAKRGIAATPDYTQAVNALDSRQAARYTIERYRLADAPEALIREWTQMGRQAYRDAVPLKPGAAEFVRALRARDVRIAAATALTEELYGPALRRLGLEDCFDAFSCCAEVSRPKGFPDVYLLAAERLGVPPPSCAVFEDLLIGIRGAKSGGFFTCGVYDDASSQDWPEITRTADCSIRSFIRTERLMRRFDRDRSDA